MNEMMDIYIEEMEYKKQNETTDSIVLKVESMATSRKKLIGHWNGIKQKLSDISQNRVGRTTVTGTESRRLTNECTPPQFDKNYYEEQFHFLRNQLKSTDDRLNEYHKKTGNFVKQIDRLERKREELVEMIKDTLIEMKKAIRQETKQCATCEKSTRPIFDPTYSMEVFLKDEITRKNKIGNRMAFPSDEIIETSRLQLKNLLEEDARIQIADKQNTQEFHYKANRVELSDNQVLKNKRNMKAKSQNMKEEKEMKMETVAKENTRNDQLEPWSWKENETKISYKIAKNAKAMIRKEKNDKRIEIRAEENTQNVHLNPWLGKEDGTKISNESAEKLNNNNPKAKSQNGNDEKGAIEGKDDLVIEEMKKQINGLQKQLLKEKKIIFKANEKNFELQNSLIEAEKAHQGHLEDLKKERDGFLSAFKEKREEEERKVAEIVKNIIKDQKSQQSELENFRVELEREKSTMKHEMLKERQRNKELIGQKNDLARELFKMKDQMKMNLTEQKNVSLDEVNPGPQKEQQLPSTVKLTAVISRTNSKNKKTRKKIH